MMFCFNYILRMSKLLWTKDFFMGFGRMVHESSSSTTMLASWALVGKGIMK